MLFGKLLPREGNFFELFNQHAAFITEGARAFMLMIENYGDLALRERYGTEVVNAERAADKVRAALTTSAQRELLDVIKELQIVGVPSLVTLLADNRSRVNELLDTFPLLGVSQGAAVAVAFALLRVANSARHPPATQMFFAS